MILADLFAPLASVRIETLAFAYLDREGHLLGMRHAPSPHAGSITLPLRAMMADVLAFDAQCVAMAHNHPSGDPEPSREDLTATRRIALVLDALGIRLVDHLVLSRSGTTSLRARGLL